MKAATLVPTGLTVEQLRAMAPAAPTIVDAQSPFYRQGRRHARELLAATGRAARHGGDNRAAAQLSFATQLLMRAGVEQGAHVDDVLNAMVGAFAWALLNFDEPTRQRLADAARDEMLKLSAGGTGQ